MTPPVQLTAEERAQMAAAHDEAGEGFLPDPKVYAEGQFYGPTEPGTYCLICGWHRDFHPEELGGHAHT